MIAMSFAHPAPVAPEGCTHLKLRRLLRSVARWYDEDLRDLGLKGTQYSLLSFVLKMSPVRPGELAAALGMDASTLTRNLRPLVAAGWVEQQAGDDARSRHVVVTPAGRALRERAKARWKHTQQRVNVALGASRAVALHALLDDCYDRIESAAHAAPPAPRQTAVRARGTRAPATRR